MEADREALCGPKGRHQVERSAWHGWSADSPVKIEERQVAVPRLRVRSAELPGYHRCASRGRRSSSTRIRKPLFLHEYDHKSRHQHRQAAGSRARLA